MTRSPQKPLAICLMGPTASGKTDLALKLADQLNVQIISVDSALVYRGLDIGSAKPSVEEQSKAPHELIDICDPSQPYSAADFCRDATLAIARAVEAGKTPLLVGGTMLYFKALLEGLSDLPEADSTIREQIEAEALSLGWPALHEKLKQVDPVSAEKIHPNHSQRLGRALEVFRITGKPLSSFQAQLRGGLIDRYNWVQIAVAPRDRKVIHARIEKRFAKMLDLGLIEEVRALKQRGDLSPDLPAVRAVGYRQVWQHLEGEFDREELLDRGIAATRQLAKRQFTWLRKWPDLQWVYSQDEQGKLYSNEALVSRVLEIIDNRACD